MAENSNTGRLDFYRTRLAEETPLTMGVLLALAQADLSYKPHERSSTAGQIISTIIKGLEIRNDLAAQRHADIAPRSAASYQPTFDRWGQKSHRFTESQEMRTADNVQTLFHRNRGVLTVS